MKKFDTKKYPIYASFLNQLAKDLTKFYYAKLDKPFKITNKMKGKGYAPVTTSDKAFEKFIRSKISKKFPNHQIIGEEYGHKNTKSEFSWVIDPIDGTRSYVVGNPSWSNLISLNYNGEPVLGLANFPKMKKYYLNLNKNSAYVFENNKKRKLKINTKLNFTNAKLAAAFHHHLSLKQQLKIKKFIKRMQFPCFDALTYCQLAEGRIEIVAQCANKIWDIHPLIPIIRAAGAIITTWDNKNPVLGGNILVSNNKQNHQIIGEEYGHKNTKSEFSWVIDPIDGTRSYVVGNPSWSNLISLNYNGEPILGLANFPKMRKYYLNVNKNSAFVFENKKKKKT